MRERAQHGGHATVQVVPHGDLLAGRLRMQVDDAEERKAGVHEQLAGQVDDGHLAAVGGRPHGDPAPGAPEG